jgi:hypothetical protein
MDRLDPLGGTSRLRLGSCTPVYWLSAPATIVHLFNDVKIAAAAVSPRWCVAGCAVKTFNDGNDPPPDLCEIDWMAHGGTSVLK